MTETQFFNAIGIETQSSDVIFITNQPTIPMRVGGMLQDEGYCWEKISVKTFIDHIDQLGVIGTAVLDTTEIAGSQKESLCKCIEKLERSNIATILLNDHIDFPFGEFSLATSLRSASMEEFLARLETNIKSQRNQLQKCQEPTVTEKNQAAETTEQLKLAGQVQRDFLPSQLPDCGNIRWQAIYQPADWVSGDIYDISRLDEQHIGFYVADAVGHSMPAALLTMFLKQAITMRQTRGNDYQIFVPLEVIRKLNTRMVAQDLRGGLFITCCYCLLNIRTLQMTYCRAGHPYAVLIRKGRQPVQLQSQGGLIGVFPETHFEQNTIQLQHGDKLFIYSDGGENVVGGFDEKNEFVFSEEFRSITHLPLDSMMQSFDLLAKNSGVSPQEVDDVTAIALEIV